MEIGIDIDGVSAGTTPSFKRFSIFFMCLDFETRTGASWVPIKTYPLVNQQFAIENGDL